MPRDCTDQSWLGVFFVVLFTCMLIISDLRKLSHKRQRARRKAEINHLLRLFVMNIHSYEQKAELRVYA